MNYDFELLSLQSPVGKGQENNPDDIEAIDARLRKINAYSPPPEYADNPQRYATEPMVDALERYQERNGLKIDGIANPGGPTERAINNHLLEKPRGAGLLYDPPSSLAGTVGNGFENRPKDVAGVQRRLGALNYLPEDPFDRPRGFIDEATTNGIKAFQRAKGLAEDGWLAPRGETERALDNAIADLARAKGRDWFAFAQRAGRAQRTWLTNFREPGEDPIGDASEDDGVIPAKAPPGATLAPPSAPQLVGFGSRLIEINPRYLPPKLPDLRKTGPMPRDLQWSNPGELPNTPVFPKFRLGSPTKNGEPPSVNDLPRALGLPPDQSLDAEVKRALPIPPRPTAQPDVYVPQPGSPLRIPIIDIHHGGMRGDPRSIQTTKATTEAIEKACEEVFGNKEVSFETKMEKHYPGTQKGTTKGSSFADEWVGMTVKAKGFTIHFVSDSYTSRVDGSPSVDEDRRFPKLEYNRRDEKHEVTVRVPKVWKFGQRLDHEKLYEVAKKICEQIKNMIDKGEIGPDKGRLKVVETLKELVKPKKRPAPEPEEPSEP